MRDGSNMVAIDPLSDVLSLLDARCGLSGQLIAGGTWARRFANLGAIKLCAITEGTCWYFMDGLAGAAMVQSGDVLVMNGTRSLVLASDASLIPTAVTSSLQRDDEGSYRLGYGEGFAMLSGMVQIDSERQALLLSGLPPLIHVRANM